MAIFDHFPDILRGMYNEGLDEVLIFAVIFIIIIVTGKDSESAGNLGLLPLIVISAFLLFFVGLSRNEDAAA
ncbi:MAG TPA: hypothetical protein VHT96_09665 [Clostridia bacterium]|nr:hypothetical protein [Clostridia bacterium]